MREHWRSLTEKSHPADENPVGRDRVAIIGTATIVAGMMRTAPVPGRGVPEIGGRARGKIDLIGTDRQQGRREPTETGHLWDRDRQNHGVIETGRTDTDKFLTCGNAFYERVTNLVIFSTWSLGRN